MKIMDSSRVTKPVMVLSTAGALFLAPGAGSTGGQAPFGAGVACANGSCCEQAGSICSLDGKYFPGYYFQNNGPCS
jgi:hypothetical protein